MAVDENAGQRRRRRAALLLLSGGIAAIPFCNYWANNRWTGFVAGGLGTVPPEMFLTANAASLARTRVDRRLQSPAVIRERRGLTSG